MKKINKQLIVRGLILGMFFGAFFVPILTGGKVYADFFSSKSIERLSEYLSSEDLKYFTDTDWMDEADPTSEFIRDHLVSHGYLRTKLPNCDYDEDKCLGFISRCSWLQIDGGAYECVTKPEKCHGIEDNYIVWMEGHIDLVDEWKGIPLRDEVTKYKFYADTCEASGCVMTSEEVGGSCTQRSEFCATQKQSECNAVNNNCSWDLEANICQQDSSIKDLALLCFCYNTRGYYQHINDVDEGECKTNTNFYWEKEIPEKCMTPLNVSDVMNLCGGKLTGTDENGEEVPLIDLMSDIGKRDCGISVTEVIQEEAEKEIAAVEAVYEASTKDAAAEKARLAGIAGYEQSIGGVYPGPAMSGIGLTTGASLAHEKLTKSISHETSLKRFILGWIRFALELVAILAVVAVVWAGILYITDMGDGGNQEKAKKILIWVAVGVLVITGSYAIVNTLMTANFAGIINTFHV